MVRDLQACQIHLKDSKHNSKTNALEFDPDWLVLGIHTGNLQVLWSIPIPTTHGSGEYGLIHCLLSMYQLLYLGRPAIASFVDYRS